MATWKFIIVSGEWDVFPIISMRRNKTNTYTLLPPGQSLVSCQCLNKGLFFFHTIHVCWGVLMLSSSAVSKAFSKHLVDLKLWPPFLPTTSRCQQFHIYLWNSSKLIWASVPGTVIVSSGRTKAATMELTPRGKGCTELYLGLVTFTPISFSQWFLTSEICFLSY